MGVSSNAVFQQLDDRAIFYKHHDGTSTCVPPPRCGCCVLLNLLMLLFSSTSANFYSALSYVIGKALSNVPQMLVDALFLGSLVYWMVGFVPQASAFIIFLCLFFLFNLMMSQLFELFASCSPSKSVYLATATVAIFANLVMSGYIVSPQILPKWWIWLYYCVPSSWVYRGMLINQFHRLGDVGDAKMKSMGFVHHDGEPYVFAWIWYSFLFLFGALVVSVLLSAFFLHNFHMEPKQAGKNNASSSTADTTEQEQDADGGNQDSSFVPVDLSFSHLCYEVKASTGSNKLRLLNDISGIFRSGRMCALMGEVSHFASHPASCIFQLSNTELTGLLQPSCAHQSGAGKTTLMDVIALRKVGVVSLGKNKSSGISGDVLLNGFPQEEVSFRRCSGYVEQVRHLKRTLFFILAHLSG